MAFEHIAIVGAGAWGTALANVAARAGRGITLLARDAGMVARAQASGENPRLPGVRLERSVKMASARAAIENADVVLLAAPAQALRDAVRTLAPANPGLPIVACAK